ncbi:ABC transporter permease [Spelaeicoccus albus]|uniref:Simple sugar transport system permease protein n=1 Tax=Spelaeicoccus albus TaxID=1280376 RepID=A0A7Z0IJ91_9MICO|nr:ABC transporter permease [Spelaeicoccus albus]NYI69273.1 simple sugar transport system permease protein [Spelaeicoccus albus]
MTNETVTEPTPDAPLSETARTESTRSLRAPIVYAVLGLAALILFGLTSPGDQHSTFGLSESSDFFQFSPLGVPSKLTAVALGIVCLVIAGYSLVATIRHKTVPVVLPYVFGVAWVLAFLVWAIAGKQISFVSLIQGSLILAVPLVFGSMAGILCERSGVVNIAIEGQLLAGAFLSAVVATITNNNWVGLLAAVAAGVAVSALLAVFTIKYAVNQIIVGVVVNVLVLGLTSFLYSQVLADNGDKFNNPTGFGSLKIPLLGDIPVIGPIVFDQTVMVYMMYVVVIVLNVALFKTRWGLRVRAVGEHPQAADTLGVKVNRTRYFNVLLSGVVAGIGGAFFTLGSNIPFDKEMTAGKGYIALAAVIFGRWNPVGAFSAALLFGFADNLQNILGILRTPLPSEFLQMAPYLATIFAVAGLVGKSRPPAASGEPYTKG